MNKDFKKLQVVERINKKNKIAAIKCMKDFDIVLDYANDLAAAFLIMGNISNIKRYVDAIQSKGLPVFVHIEKIGGLALNNEGIEFISSIVKPVGIITTKPNLIKKAQTHGLMVIQRVFMIDTEVFENTLNLKENRPDIIEIMPSPLYHIISELTSKMEVPIITGGLIHSTDDMRRSLNAGAIAVSTSNNKVWRENVNLN